MANADGVDTPLLTLRDFKTETLRGTAGFVRVGQTRAGAWWLIDAEDRPFFGCGVEAVNRAGRAHGRGGPYAETVDARYGADSAAFAEATLARLRGWGVNVLGAWTGAEFFDRGMAFAETLEFSRIAPETTIRLGGAWLPDVFSPTWIAACEAHAAERCTVLRASGGLIGYFTDHDLDWAQLRAMAADGEGPRRIERPSLLQICLSLEPSYPAWHAAWEYVRATHGGELTALAQAWGVDLPNKEALRQLTLADTPLLTVGYRRDQAGFVREFARRYFETCAAAIRRFDPHHLILGCRFEEAPGEAIWAESVTPQVDVLSCSGASGAEDFLEMMDAAGGGGSRPIFVGEGAWTGNRFTQNPDPDEPRGYTSVERMLARGRTAMERWAGHPAVVGYAWSRWVDQCDDRPPFGQGLVRVDDTEAREHTELFADLNGRAAGIHHGAAGPAQGG